MRNIMIPLGLAAAMAVAGSAGAQHEWTSSRHDGHAPIGVMGDHVHKKGEYTLSYRFMRMYMGGNRTGSAEVTPGAVLEDFMVAPLDMTMTMHMAGIMYAPGDAVTLMAMANWTESSMDHLTRSGANFDARSSGPGDASLTALVGLKRTGPWRAHLNAGLSVPVGSTGETGVNPASMGRPVQLPYPMQLGSGTWDLVPGLTILGMRERLSWGFQGRAGVRLGENDRGYTLGNVAEGSAWFAARPNDHVSISARVLAKRWGDHQGHDDAYGNPMMVPTVREDLRGGVRVDIPLGLNVYFPGDPLKGHRLAAEWHVPVYQDLHGPQLQTDWILTVGWHKSFDPGGGG